MGLRPIPFPRLPTAAGATAGQQKTPEAGFRGCQDPGSRGRISALDAPKADLNPVAQSRDYTGTLHGRATPLPVPVNGGISAVCQPPPAPSGRLTAPFPGGVLGRTGAAPEPLVSV